jgi:hypothetical protein
MREILGGVVINELEYAPLSDYVLDFLISRKRECPFLDFKLKIDIGKNSNFPELAKHIFAFSNYGAGWIMIGWDEQKKSQYYPVGLPEDYNVDGAVLQEKFNSYSNKPIQIEYKEFTKNVDGKTNRFAVIFIPPSYEILKPIKDGKYIVGDKEKIVFKEGDVYYRRGSQSIHASPYEMELLQKRLKMENYRMSVLSGEPDAVEETIYSNLFPITKLPEYIYSGIKKEYDEVSMKVLLKQQHVFPEFYFKFKIWNKRIITFENLLHEDNPYRKLVDTTTIKKEPSSTWIEDPDKYRIFVELLDREIKHYAIKKGMFLFDERNKLYYPSLDEQTRKEKWISRSGSSERTVASKMWAEQLQSLVYWHAAFTPKFIKLDDSDFYFRVYPTFALTHDGKKYSMKGFKEGTIITRLSYNKYNRNYLNTILFWIFQLGNGKSIKINDYLEISNDPLKIEIPVGIMYDLPSSEFRIETDEDIEVFSEEGGSAIV